MNNRLRQFLVIAAVLGTIGVNGLANALPINGLTTGEISDSFDVLFVPAGYVFSIWGLIYLGLVAYAVFQALPSQRENPRLQAIGTPFLVASVANIAWIFLWHYQQFALTLVAMVTLLVSLIVIYQRLRAAHSSVGTAERTTVNLTFSVYLGWVSVATIANVTSVLSFYGWNGFGLSEATWAIIMLLVGAGLAAVMTLRERDVAYDLVFVWAYVGIGVAQSGTPTVATTAYVLAAVIALMGLIAAWPSNNKLVSQSAA